MTKTMAEVLAEHWSRSTHTDRKPFVDKCDGCGAVIFSWGDGVDANEALASHQAAALSTAGFGLVADAQRESWDEGCRAVWAYLSNQDPRRKRPANPYTEASS